MGLRVVAGCRAPRLSSHTQRSPQPLAVRTSFIWSAAGQGTVKFYSAAIGVAWHPAFFCIFLDHIHHSGKGATDAAQSRSINFVFNRFTRIEPTISAHSHRTYSVGDICLHAIRGRRDDSACCSRMRRSGFSSYCESRSSANVTQDPSVTCGASNTGVRQQESGVLTPPILGSVTFGQTTERPAWKRRPGLGTPRNSAASR